ncbi:TPA: hypothetical protein QDZ10_003023 [Stenotrophomonas maltophilia]|nr:hypothetical protein [Stenotrophomonas maltophilia]
MTRRTGTALALLLSLCAPVATATAAASGATVDANSTAPTATAAYLAEFGAALQQADRGDSLGASIVIDRLLVDPRLADIGIENRSHAWAAAAMVASTQKQSAVALQRMQQALAINPLNASARLQLAWLQMVEQQQPEAAADSVLRAIADGDGAPDMSPEMVWQLDTQLKQQPAKRLALLQGLFESGWKIEGIEPAELWVVLATLQAEAGQGDKVAATLERIDAPIPLIRLRADKRFDTYLRRDDPRHDPVAAARRHIDRQRVDTMLAPGLNEAAVELSGALMVAGELQEVVGMTEKLAVAAAEATAAPASKGRYVAWMLDIRSRALRRLGKPEEAVAAQQLALRMTDPQGDTVSQNLNLASLYVALGRPQLARDVMQDVGSSISEYGASTQALIELRAALQLKDAAAAQRARDRLLANRALTPHHYREGLLVDHRMDEAAASLLEQLADPMERGTALFDLQDVRRAPTLPADAQLQASWDELKQRADVQAAVNRVGRIDSYPLFAN